MHETTVCRTCGQGFHSVNAQRMHRIKSHRLAPLDDVLAALRESGRLPADPEPVAANG